MNIPPEYEALLAKILSWFDNQIYPTWATRYFHTSREAKKVNKEKTFMPSSAAAWKLLTPEEKDAWGTSAWWATLTSTERREWGVQNRYQLFLADFSHRRKNGLSLPGVPNDFHNMFVLQMQNPGGAINVRLRRDEKELVGPISVEFTYKKQDPESWHILTEAGDYILTEAGDYIVMDPPPGGFHLVATAYYFEQGKNSTEVYQWNAPGGNVDWNKVSFSFGATGRKFYHLTLIWYLDGYDAVVHLDHLLIKSAGVIKYLEYWAFKAGTAWAYDNLYRKTGWLFTPSYDPLYFDVVYLD